MNVVNVHERDLPIPPAEVGKLIDALGSERDGLWPKTMWPAMRFDRPLGVGAAGGHGPIRYTVVEFRPGQSIRFRFSAPAGFNGYHWLEVLPKGENASILRHVLAMAAQGSALLSWPLLFRWLHDACVEDALSVAEASLGIKPTARPWSLWVKVTRWLMTAGKASRQQMPNPTFQRAAGRHSSI